MKKALRKLRSCDKRDIWDNPRIYDFSRLSVDRIKFKLKHLPKKDRRMREVLKEMLRWHIKKNDRT